MKKINYLLLAILITTYQNAFSQEMKASSKVSTFIDLGLSAGSSTYSGSLSFNRTHGLLKSKKLRLGYGIRFSGFGGTDLYYTTAPAKYSTKVETVDSIFVKSPLTMGINGVIHIEYNFTPKLKIGFNIDAIGMGFGKKQTVDFISSNRGAFPSLTDSKPTSMNVLLVGDNDIGQLKSEFVVSYLFLPKWGIKAGLDFTFSEQTTAQKLTNNNDRFRHKAMMATVGISYYPFNPCPLKNK